MEPRKFFHRRGWRRKVPSVKFSNLNSSGRSVSPCRATRGAGIAEIVVVSATVVPARWWVTESRRSRVQFLRVTALAVPAIAVTVPTAVHAAPDIAGITVASSSTLATALNAIAVSTAVSVAAITGSAVAITGSAVAITGSAVTITVARICLSGRSFRGRLRRHRVGQTCC